jgi:hypothetical protein
MLSKTEKLAADLERKLQREISRFAEQHLQTVSEGQYCEIVLTALEGISSGVRMRQEELEADE